MPTRRPYAWLSLIAFAAHGLLLLNDGLYSEDWMWFRAVQTHRFADLAILGDRGALFDAYFFWFLGFLANPLFAFRLLVFLSALATALLIYRIAVTARFSSTTAFFVAALAITFPGFQTWPLMSTTVYVACIALYAAGAACAVEAEQRGRPWRIAANVIFFAAFDLNSLLVFHYGFVALLFWRFRRRYFDYLLLPIVFRIAQVTLFPPRGVFAQHNRLILSPSSIFSATTGFLARLYEDLNAILRFALEQPLFFVVAAIVAVLLARRWTVENDDSRFLLIGGTILLPFAIAPYILVGKYPFNWTTTTRHEILLGAPIAMIVAGALLALPSRSRAIALILALAAFAGLTFANHMKWMAASVRQHAALEALRQIPNLESRKTLTICDRFVDQPRSHFSSWYGLIIEATNGRSQNLNVQLTDDEGAADLVATETLRPFYLQHTDFELVTHYLGTKCMRPRMLATWLRSLVTIRARSSPSPPLPVSP